MVSSNSEKEPARSLVFHLMRIAEKLGFMKVRTVEVCAKAGIGRKMGHKKAYIPANLR
jgi:hypothetical protein